MDIKYVILKLVNSMKSITVNLTRESDLYERYNDDVSNALIKYLIKEAKTKDKIEVIIKTKLEIDNIEFLIKKGLQQELNDTKRIDKFYDFKQLRFFIIGIIFLLISTLMGYEILRELVLIIGWFAIYEVVEITFNTSSILKRKREAIKKLLGCHIKINNE